MLEVPPYLGISFKSAGTENYTVRRTWGGFSYDLEFEIIPEVYLGSGDVPGGWRIRRHWVSMDMPARRHVVVLSWVRSLGVGTLAEPEGVHAKGEPSSKHWRSIGGVGDCGGCRRAASDSIGDVPGAYHGDWAELFGVRFWGSGNVIGVRGRLSSEGVGGAGISIWAWGSVPRRKLGDCKGFRGRAISASLEAHTLSGNPLGGSWGRGAWMGSPDGVAVQLILVEELVLVLVLWLETSSSCMMTFGRLWMGNTESMGPGSSLEKILDSGLLLEKVGETGTCGDWGRKVSMDIDEVGDSRVIGLVEVEEIGNECNDGKAANGAGDDNTEVVRGHSVLTSV
ncbi:hypothetical protein ARMSODRAFT_974681 [Armillaria solidipes]|uniref:Uncharacterized protein n=1 Tax=Armillaria solidipes TaxID=1076256 RepID=A0A2H3BT96_9AGAR|nr:hypothetical protein ARMSODRAFT_974681 [Armillaria solidipes]